MLKMKFLASALVMPIALSVYAQATPPAQDKDKATANTQQQQQQAPKSDFKPYADVIKGAVTQDGVFKVHRIEDKVLWEIPEKLLGRDFLWQNEVSETRQNSGTYSGLTASTNVIKFTRRNKKIYMRSSSYALRNLAKNMTIGLDQISVDPILFQFDIQTEGDNKSVVIDVTSLFLTDPEPFSVKSAFGSPGVDGSKSWIEKVKAFPTNIETRANLTFLPGRGSANPLAGPSTSGPVTALIHSSLLLLPETPMVGRYKDSRIGFFTIPFTVYDAGKPVEAKEYITRFRLEKKDPNAEVSEPVKPITFYLAREVPDRWREPLRRGVLMWNAAFEKAGFKNAVVCLDAPSREQDPDWDAEDARYSVIRWAPSPTANAMGPSIQDPRSGETLNAHVIFWHNIVDLVEKWYAIQCGAIDPRARKLPLPNDLMDDLVAYVCAHEVGHTLGLEHNFRASSAYTIAQLRNPEFTKNNGVSSSIMSYSRNNYVAQPGDGVVYSTNGKLGPYDFFAIEYGYKNIPGANTPEAEIPHLDRFLARQVTDRTVRFGNYKYSIDPTTMSENISDDPVTATRLGLKNLDIVARNALAMNSRFGEDYSKLAVYMREINSTRLTWLMHVIRNVGGVIENDVHAGRGGAVFSPVSKQKQAESVNFLVNEGIFASPGLVQPEVVTRIAPNGYLNTLNSTQSLIFAQLFAEARLQRLYDWEHIKGASQTYTVNDLTNSVFSAVWKDLDNPKPEISLPRREMQRNFLRAMEGRLAGSGKTRTDFILVGTLALRDTAKKIDKALARTSDKMTAAHLTECRRWINNIINDKVTAPASGGAASLASLFGYTEKEQPNLNPHICFGRDAIYRELLRAIEE